MLDSILASGSIFLILFILFTPELRRVLEENLPRQHLRQLEQREERGGYEADGEQRLEHGLPVAPHLIPRAS